jgi:glycine C-acetyltransferase
MPFDRIRDVLARELVKLEDEGRRKGAEAVVTEIVPAAGDRGPRVRIAGEGERLFLRMNSNGYLGMALREDVQLAEAEASRRFGTGPQAVRFISGTFAPHVDLERRLADFHGREAAMIFSSAYATVMGVLPALLAPGSAVVSDELNHNCIINAIRLSSAGGEVERFVFDHGDLAHLEQQLERAAASGARRAIIVTDGVFSMRGDVAPLCEIVAIAERFDPRFAENAIVVVDDSHGVGVLGEGGRGSEEEEGARADVLVGTLGKAFGVNGGYAVGDRVLIEHLREVSPFYVYSNPITAGEAAAAAAAVDLLDSEAGRVLLRHLREMTRRFEQGLVALGFETIPGPHPVVPLVLHDTALTATLVGHLREHGVLATGLAHPVVPRGEEEIRFQLSADHTPADVDEALEVLGRFASTRPLSS